MKEISICAGMDKGTESCIKALQEEERDPTTIIWVLHQCNSLYLIDSCLLLP